MKTYLTTKHKQPKIVQILAFILDSSQSNDRAYAYKTLFEIDREYFLERGKPMSGLDYLVFRSYKVPDKLIKEFEESELFNQYFRILDNLIVNQGAIFNVDDFTSKELIAIRDVINKDKRRLSSPSNRSGVTVRI